MKIAIYKYTEVPYNGEHKREVLRVHIIPDSKTDDECTIEVEKYNASQDKYIASIVNVDDEIAQAVKWCLKDRRLDVQRHISVLEDIKTQISDIDDYLYSSIRDIKNSLKIERSEK